MEATNTMEVEHSHIIADHYNKLPNVNQDERKKSSVIHLRNHNNWIKSVLFSQFVMKDDSVLDLAGGKGGDMRKWVALKIGHLVLVDIAENSVRQACDRYNEMKNPSFPAFFMSADCWKKGFLASLPDHLKNLKFDVVSCQFAFHYAFETEERARGALYNISSRLMEGGIFVGTIPDSCLLYTSPSPRDA
eukprot:TRINITY_DN10381_c0_g1_i1.p1 TRINITY_DN10381_c0_g1~~TRINITY_DN10381_c0_g1_i1.p1  ORF type:complete len:190 (-),score=39.02 TRINITY_DN10381_c0_g1_i1:22-591(-)